MASRPEPDDPSSNRYGIFIDVHSRNSSERIGRREPSSNKGIESRQQESSTTTSGIDHESRKIRGRISDGSAEGQRADGGGRIPGCVPRTAGGAS